jgi:hypothetical protein
MATVLQTIAGRGSQVSILDAGTTLDASGFYGTPESGNVGVGNAGFGPASLKAVASTFTPSVGQLGSTATVISMIRLPVTAILQKIRLVSDSGLDTNGVPTLAWNVFPIWSDAPIAPNGPIMDGTLVQLAGFSLNTSFDASGLTAIASANTFGRTTGNTLDVTLAARNTLNNNKAATALVQPLWQAFGQSFAGSPANPAGFFDICMQVQAVAATAASATMCMYAEYC